MFHNFVLTVRLDHVHTYVDSLGTTQIVQIRAERAFSFSIV